jgi:hypothetical protein
MARQPLRLFLLPFRLDRYSLRDLDRDWLDELRRSLACDFRSRHSSRAAHDSPQQPSGSTRISERNKMSCCGRKREALKAQESPRETRRAASVPASLPLPDQPSASGPGSEQPFHNSGNANLSVRGPISGRVYLFPANGHTVFVAPQDAPYLTGISRILPGERLSRHKFRRKPQS